MALELLGAKIIAPYYGTSLIVWSSVLGITLGGLAVGYFLGGVLAQRGNLEKKLQLIFLGAALLSTLSIVIGPAVMSATLSMGIRWGSIISVMSYLLIPVLLLGSTSPLLIRLVDDRFENAGKASGTIYAVSTLGGIIATFLFGFYIIPTIGLKMSAFIVAVTLLTNVLILFVNFRNKIVLGTSFLVLIVVTSLSFISFEQTIDRINILYNSSSMIGDLKVIDSKAGVGTNSHTMRLLLMNGIPQTISRTDNLPFSFWNYPHYLGCISSVKPPGSKALLLGLGGGSIAYELKEMGFDLTAVEFDSRLKTIATDYFELDTTGMDIYIDDARHFINICKENYDVIVVDLLSGEVQPNHVLTIESFERIKEILNPNGILVINYQGNIDIDDVRDAPLSLMKTLETAGFSFQYLYSDIPSDYLNDMVFYASIGQIDWSKEFQKSRYNERFKSLDIINSMPFSNRDIDYSEGIILSDDRPMLDILNSNTILEWRRTQISKFSEKLAKSGNLIK